ncbi:chaperone NapD [Ideonella sp.]|uniref:chaperone NapD n=1 Tax=Ideonella sp. TaxID=1929293 RepID=UPI0035ADF285
MRTEELHIASLVIHSTPHRLPAVTGAIAALPGALVHASSEHGKAVVTLEAPSAESMTAMVANIQHIDGVLSATLVYQCADSLDAMNEEIPDA